MQNDEDRLEGGVADSRVSAAYLLQNKQKIAAVAEKTKQLLHGALGCFLYGPDFCFRI